MNTMLYLIPFFFFLFFSSCSEVDANVTRDTSDNDKENAIADYNKWKISNGKFYFDNQWVFLKIARPLLNYADEKQVDNMISNLKILKQKNYNTILITCYWEHFDINGDGKVDVSLEPLNRVINAVYKMGMYPSLSVETYPVGGAKIPDGFWDNHPNAYAINNEGFPVKDTEYGFNTKVVSIYYDGFRNTVHNLIKEIAKGIDTKKILYFESTVEPQYMGNTKICYSDNARREYDKWRGENNILDPSTDMPKDFPIPESFVNSDTWNTFRAFFLAKWINEDHKAYKEIAGDEAYTAVDYLDADESVQKLRMGIPEVFLANLTEPDIIQINWSWNLVSREPNQKAYDRVWEVNKKYNKKWAITEHMTLNGFDFSSYETNMVEQLLENTIKQSTRFGWEFVNVVNNSDDTFTVYNSDWSPKKVMSIVDNNWSYWIYRIKEVEKEKND